MIEQITETYQSVLELLKRIERLLKQNNYGEVAVLLPLYQEKLQSIRKINGRSLRATLRAEGETDGLDAILKQIQQFNKQLLPKIKSTMAIKTNELGRLRQGSVMMNKYHSHTDRTGRLLSKAG